MPETDLIAGTELGYVALLFALFVVPRVLQRYRLPSAITSFALGAVAGIGFGLYQHDSSIHLLAAFGIVSLFLFAGLEVDTSQLKSSSSYLSLHLLLRCLLLVVGTVILQGAYGLGWRPSVLIALALFTPSTGFILDALAQFGLNREEQFWVKSKAIATELLALTLLFIAMQSTTVTRFVTSTILLVGIVVILPWIFRLFAVKIAPYAPKSEFAFLLMMALVAAYATRQLGVYYLVGAFLVGVAARRFRRSLPAMASERMLHAVEVFASFFAPFYFFGAGAELRREDITWLSFGVGCLFVVVAVPVRIAAVTLLRKWKLGESFGVSSRIALPMLPTLVFTLVLAGILRDNFGVGDPVFGGLIFYAIITTLMPGFLFGAPVPVFDAPELPEAQEPPDTPGAVMA
ncbi:MAG: cation:proton antiporter [Gemmatimonadota bacterium]